MIYSMTGYGKSEVRLESGKLTVEFRSVNGKSADIGIKSQLLPKDREIELRKRIASLLQRGTIDMFLSWQPDEASGARRINTALAMEYYGQIAALAESLGVPAAPLESVLRMPDVLDLPRSEVITPENWPLVDAAIEEALAALIDYRAREGASLYDDVTSRVHLIERYYDEIEKLAPERISAARERIGKAAAELSVRLDPERLEQEMVYYLEKLDINEEKVRLRQHCRYFIETIDSEPFPGKKLGFIIQEMGREINTTGSKANHAGIQAIVVKMKDELEKIREQSMNIL